MSRTHVPSRTCIGCRQTAPQHALVRLAVDRRTEPSVIEVDTGRVIPGRGAWVHPHPDCIARAQAKGIKRALRIAEPVDMTKVTTWRESLTR